MTAPRADRGFVLLNALVLLVALAGIATLLLARAEGTRLRQTEMRDAAQLRAYLDSAEALAITRLAADRGGPPGDHAGEAWAQAVQSMALDRGRVTARIVDLQGRFNVNWLANPADEAARDAFERLVRRLGIAPQRVEDMVAHLSRDGADPARYAGRNPPVRPVGGPVLTQSQLAEVPGMSMRDLDRLAPFVSALPADRPLNLNTAPAEVLQALIPELNAAMAAQFLQMRRSEPFTSVDAALSAIGDLAGAAAVAGIDPARFDIGSDWFALTATAELETRRASRLSVMERRPLPETVRVAYRLDGARTMEAGRE